MRSIFIVNPGSGPRDATEVIRAELERLRPQGCEVHVTTAPMDAARYVRSVCESTTGPLRFFACGGDGTLNEVINGAAGFSHAAVGCYPCGSGNDFVKYYGGKTPFLSIEALLKGRTEPIDLLRVNDRYAVNIVNFGFDARVAERMIAFRRFPLLKGHRAYYAAIARSLFDSMRTNVHMRADGETLCENQLLLCTLGNGGFVGGSFHCSPRADVADGLMEVCAVSPISLLTVARLMTPYKRGELLDNPAFAPFIRYRRAKSVSIEAPAPIALCLDGEMVYGTDFTVTCEKHALTIILPEGAKKQEGRT